MPRIVYVEVEERADVVIDESRTVFVDREPRTVEV